MQPADPYASPTAQIEGSAPDGDSSTVPPGVVDKLRQTRPWTQFIGVLALLGTVLFLILGVLASDAGSFSRVGPSRARTSLLFFLVLAVVCLSVGLTLMHYNTSITNLMEQETEERLYEALRQQRNFWIMAGVVSSLFLLLMLSAMVFSLVT